MAVGYVVRDAEAVLQCYRERDERPLHPGISVPAVGRQPVRIEIRELGCSSGAVNQTE
jgi:hypothetical protein